MTTYKPRSMLVTGGAGFIGANFIRHILTHEPGINIINLDKLTYAGSLQNLENLPADHYHFVQGDILDSKLVNHILQHNHIDTIVHFAAESHVDRSIANPFAFVETNVLGTSVLLEAAYHHWFKRENRHADQCRFHHISTDEVYGSLQLNEPPFTENHCYRPNSPYAASKASADHLVYAFYHTYGLPIIISHCSNNYGPYQHKEKFIPTIILSCLNNQPIPVYGKGKNIRDWLHVTDHCTGILTLLKNGRVGQKYNLGGMHEIENLALVNQICDYMDMMIPRATSHKKLIHFVTDRPGHDLRYAIDISIVKNKFGWMPKITFESGLKQTIEFYLKQENKVSTSTF